MALLQGANGAPRDPFPAIATTLIASSADAHHQP